MTSTEKGTPSPGRALSKLRRNKGVASASTNTLKSGNAADDDDSSEGGLRASMDAAFGKVRDVARRRSVDERRGSDDAASKRLSVFIHRKKRGAKRDAPDLERNLSARSGEDSLFPSNRSESSFVESGHSSLLTDDDDCDHERESVRPTLSPHQSHAGLLTLSSPEINATAHTVASLGGQSTSPSNVPISDIPQIIEPSDGNSLFEATASQPTASPVEKQRDTYTLPNKKESQADESSVKSARSGSGSFGGLFKPKSRRGSTASQVGEGVGSEFTAVVPENSVPELQRAHQPRIESAVEGPDTPTKQPKRGRINTTSFPATPPNLVETPTTLVTPPTPTDPNADASTFPKRPAQVSSPPNRPLNSIESIRHRRAQSANIPSRLSNAIAAPLTPTIEESKTPGGTLTQPTTATGFFSSFFSAAQKAADQLSANVNSGIGAQGKSRVGTVQESEEARHPGVEEDTEVEGELRRSPAVKTLGKGELNLGHLGLSDEQDTSPMTSVFDVPQQDGPVQNGTTSQLAEEEAAARAVSVAYDKPVQSVISQATGRPLSVASQDRLTLGGDQTPPHSGGDFDGLARSGSVRSKLSGRRRRHRASSATTGTQNTVATGAIAAALHSSASALVNPATNGVGGGHRMTGFAVASSKRNKDFHALFRSVPEDDYLIEDYSAALQRDILLHGRLYVSESHICFSSNILGWVTNLVISFDEVVSVEKKSTAVIFPNAIVIQTLHARHTFASFVARDSTYELLIGIWKISHPKLKSSLNGVILDNADTGDKTEVLDAEEEDGMSVDGSEDEVYDEDDDDDIDSLADAAAPSVSGSDIGEAPLSRKTSAIPVGALTQQINGGGATKGVEAVDAAAAPSAAGATDFPGPPTHAPTECTEAAEHYDRPITDATIPAPLGKVYSLMFGPASNTFMRKWLVEDQKSRELNLADDKVGLDIEHKTMTFDYIKPLNSQIGPRQTKCITTNTLLACDLEKAVTIDCSTQTPDVPSGSLFTTKTRYCLMWAPGNGTRLVATCTIEWTGKSWLRGPIEKGANDGQIDYVRALIAALKAAVISKPATRGPIKKGKRKGKREPADAEAVVTKEAVVVHEQRPSDWGMLEPLHQVLTILLSLIRPFITSQVVIAVLVALLVYTWMASPRAGTQVGLPGYSTSQRLAPYEELWRREESELWDWLEDRVGLDHLYAPNYEKDEHGRQRVINTRSIGKKLESERMGERQMDDAIKVTEERLSALKEAVARKKGKEDKGKV